MERDDVVVVVVVCGDGGEREVVGEEEGRWLLSRLRRENSDLDSE